MRIVHRRGAKIAKVVLGIGGSAMVVFQEKKTEHSCAKKERVRKS
jgi:hypothetical protein